MLQAAFLAACTCNTVRVTKDLQVDRSTLSEPAVYEYWMISSSIPTTKKSNNNIKECSDRTYIRTIEIDPWESEERTLINHRKKDLANSSAGGMGSLWQGKVYPGYELMLDFGLSKIKVGKCELDNSYSTIGVRFDYDPISDGVAPSVFSVTDNIEMTSNNGGILIKYQIGNCIVKRTLLLNRVQIPPVTVMPSVMKPPDR